MPTVPLDPPTAYGLAALFVLLGTQLVRAGRGKTAFRVAMIFVTVFALTVQYFLFRWPGWMYSYLVPEAAYATGWVSPFFFFAVVGAGAAGASVSLHTIRAGRMNWAVVNVLFGLGTWALVWIVTWEQYFRIGTYETYHAGLAPPLAEVPSFQGAMNVVGAIQVIVGLSCAAWLVWTGNRARASARMQADPSTIEWRDIGSSRGAAPPSAAPPADERGKPERMHPPSSAPAVGEEGLEGGSTPESYRAREGRDLPPAHEEARRQGRLIEGGMIRGIRPIDGQPLSPLRATPAAEVADIIQRARETQHAWSLIPLTDRAAILRKAARRLLERAEEVAQILEDENGRPKAESLLSEIIPSADLFSFWTTKGPLLLQGDGVPIDPLTFPKKRGVIERVPRGVVGAITPWNFPLMLPLRAVVPALLAGNAVALKPSEHAARSGAFLGSLFEGLLPPGVLQVLQGGGDVAQAMIAAGLDSLIFIGSPRTGRVVAEACAKRLTPMTLELGGKDAAIVCADAHLERTANGLVWAAFANAGQNCAAIERCYVVEEAADRLISHLRAAIDALRLGPGEEGEVDIGPLTTPAQKEIVERQLAEARERDAGLSPPRQSPRGTGLFIPPALLIDPPEDLSLVRDETFGPILPVFRVKDEEEAIRRANASPYGLTVSIWSKDVTRAERLGRRIHAGVITVNNHAFTGGLAQAPWGGVRGSGFGVTNSAQMLEGLTRPRFVLVDRARGLRELWWYPYDRAALRLARGMIRLRAGGLANVGALGEIIQGFLGRRKSGVSRP